MKTNKLFMRLTLVLALLLTGLPSVGAFERPMFNIRIILSLVDIKPNPLYPRTPIETPQVGQTNHTLYFLDETDFVLNLYSVDDDEELTLEYSTMVPAETEAVMLPSDLSGTYVIEVIRGDQHFIGEIEL